MAIGKGINTYVGFGGEATTGTKGTIDAFHRVVDVNIEHIKDLFQSESKGAGWHGDMYYSAGRNVGTIVFEQTFTGPELFYLSMLGGYTYAANTPVAGAHTHTFSYSETVTGTALSIEAVRGVTSKERAYLGMRPSKLTIEVAPRQIARATFEVVGMGYSVGAATAATFPTFLPVLPSHLTTMTLNGTALSIKSGQIEMEVVREDDREHFGDALYKEAVVVGRPAGKFSFECEFTDETGIDSVAALELFEAGTKLSGFKLAFQGGIIVGATKYEFAVEATGGYIEKATPSSVSNKITNVTISGVVAVGLTVKFINASVQAA